MAQMVSQEYIMNPVVIEAWQVHPENLELVATWCKGRYRGLSVIFPKIRDRSKNVESQDNNHYAIPGEWVVRTAKGFIKMSDAEFSQKFTATNSRVRVL